MSAHLTLGEARRLGLPVSEPKKPINPQRKTPKPKGEYHTRCTACGDEFRTLASETRHVEQVGHHRFELIHAACPDCGVAGEAIHREG